MFEDRFLGDSVRFSLCITVASLLVTEISPHDDKIPFSLSVVMESGIRVNTGCVERANGRRNTVGCPALVPPALSREASELVEIAREIIVENIQIFPQKRHESDASGTNLARSS